MKLVYQGAWCLSLVVLVALLLRLALTASRTEIGWESTRNQWRDAAVGWAGLGQQPIAVSFPRRQAEFWLAESSSIEAKYPREADILIGAAWTLDSSCSGFYGQHLKQSEFATIAPQFGMSLDFDAIHRAEDEFELMCRDRCLELAARATSLEPHDVRWWQARALLLFRVHSGGADWEARQDSWSEVLDDCARHDPDNSLYDYLATLQLWQRAGSLEWEDDGYGFDVQDHEMFLEGLQRLETAQSKPLLLFGESGFTAVTKFLRCSSLSQLNQADVASHRLTSFRESMFFYRLWRWLEARADTAKRDNDLEAEITSLQQALQFVNQFEQADETAALEVSLTFYGLQLESMKRLQRLHEVSNSNARSDDLHLVERATKLLTDRAILARALQDWASERGENKVQAAMICSTVSLVSALLLLELGVMAFAVSWLLVATPQRGLGVLQHSAAWVVGYGLTFIVLGVAPAEAIGRPLQTTIAYGLVLAILILIAGFIVWTVYGFLKRRKFQFSLMNLMVVTLASSLVFALWPILRQSVGIIDGHPPELWLPARGWGSIDAEALRFALQLPTGSWQWVLVQWAVGFGPHVSIAVSVVCLVACHSIRSNRQRSTCLSATQVSHCGHQWGSLLRCVSKSVLAVAMIFLTIYLWFAPEVLMQMESQYQFKMTYYRAPSQHRDDIYTSVERVRSDLAKMNEIAAIVAEEMQEFQANR